MVYINLIHFLNHHQFTSRICYVIYLRLYAYIEKFKLKENVSNPNDVINIAITNILYYIIDFFFKRTINIKTF